MRPASCMFATVALLFPALAAAQTSDPVRSTTDERRLTAEQVEAVLAEAAAKHSAVEKQTPAEPAIEQADPPSPPIHGEVGFGIGTGGYREVFGSAIYPLGEDGVAAVSLDFVDWGRRRYPR